MDQKDYYTVLQIEYQATPDEIRAAYKRLALLYHPDRSRDPQATQQMQLLNEAYEILGSPEKKGRYDEERLAPAVPSPVKPPPNPVRQPPAQEPAQQNPERRKPAVHPFIELRSHFKALLYLVFLITFWFFWSLFTGQVDMLAVLSIVGFAIGIIVFMVRRLRRLVR